MADADDKLRQQQIPILHVRGTNYEIGLAIGRTFKSLIEDFFEGYTDFKNETLAQFNTPDGKKVYEGCLAVCEKRFPQYLQEIRGMSDGAKIPFNHLFLLHIESSINPFDPPDDFDESQLQELMKDAGCRGCTSVMSNCQEVILGHTEDALKQMINNFYIISAEVLDDQGEILEKFTTLTYPGQLPGGTMGFNSHGIVYSINTIFVKDIFPERTPSLFLTRAVLGARGLSDVIEILKDGGSGTADAFGINLVLANGVSGDRDFPSIYNIEVSPNQKGHPESELFVDEVSRGDCYSHCNQFLRCQHPEKPWFQSSSHVRHKILENYPLPYDFAMTKEILSQEVADGLDKVKYSIFKRALQPEDHYATICVGIFHITSRKWYMYTRPPKYSKPVAVVPMHFEVSFK